MFRGTRRVKRWLTPSPPHQTEQTDFRYSAFVWHIPLQEMDISIGLVNSSYFTIFMYCGQMAFSPTLFSGYLSGILLSDMCYRAVHLYSYPVSFPLNPLAQKRVGFVFGFKEDVMRPPSVAQESICCHPGHDNPDSHYSAFASV